MLWSCRRRLARSARRSHPSSRRTSYRQSPPSRRNALRRALETEWYRAAASLLWRTRLRENGRIRRPVRALAAGEILLNGRHDAAREQEDDDDHQGTVDHPLHRRRHEGADHLRQKPKDHAANDRPGKRALAAGDDHDDHGDSVDEQEYFGID